MRILPQTTTDEIYEKLLKETAYSIMKQVKKQLSEAHNPKYKQASVLIENLIHQITNNNVNIENIVLRVARACNSIKKLQRTDKQIQIKKLALQTEFSRGAEDQDDQEFK